MYFLDFKILYLAVAIIQETHDFIQELFLSIFTLFVFSKMPIAIFDDFIIELEQQKGMKLKLEKITYSKILIFHFFKISKFIPFLIKLRPISNQIMYVPFLIKLRCMHLNWYNLLSRVESCKKIMQVRDLRSDLHFLRIFQERCIKAGTLTVNYEKVDIDYRLKHNDLLANIVHR